MTYKVKVEYNIPDDKIKDFLLSTLPFSKFMRFKKIDESFLGYKRPKTTTQIDEIRKTKTMEYLYKKEQASTSLIFKYVSPNCSRKTFTRFLIKLSMLGFLEVNKKPKSNGGYENIWKIKDDK